MGFWTITIQGHGIHDNGRQDDANTMAATFVGELRAEGHEVHYATFSLPDDNLPGAGVTTDLLPLAPKVISNSYKVVGQTEEGQRVYMADTSVPTSGR